jgi:hypothetical protein
VNPIRPATSPVPAVPALPVGRHGAIAEPRAEAVGASSLWEALTPEERTFFEKLTALGRLSYGPAAKRAAQAPAPTGHRVDVKA